MLLIYLEVSDQPSFEYQKEIIAWAKEHFPHVTTIDLDNFSDPVLFDQVIGLLEKEDKAVVIYDIKSGANDGQIISLTNALLDIPEKVKVVFKGHHTLIERLLNILEENCIKNPTAEEEKIFLETFLNK